MFAPENSVFATIMLLGTMCCWGSWSSIRMKCNTEGPVFVILYIAGQFVTGCFYAVTLGMGTDVNGYFDSRTFFGGLSHPGAWYRIVAIMFGGCACANSDFLASCAMSRLPFAVVVPVFMGWSLIQATVLNFFIEDSDTDPYFLFAGILAAFLAICCMAISDLYGGGGGKKSDPVSDFYTSISCGGSISASGHKDIEQSLVAASTALATDSAAAEPAPNTIKSINGWIYVSVFSGVLAGIWSPLQVFGREGRNSVDNPSIILLFFQLGEVLSIPLILYYHGRYIVPVETSAEPVSPWTYWQRAVALPWIDKMYGFLAGCVVASGTYIFFTASEVIPSTIAFAISSCAPLVTIALGVVVFRQLKGAPFLQTFYIAMATLLFVVAIVLMVLADMY